MNEELLLQAPKSRRVPSSPHTLSILVNEELLLQVPDARVGLQILRVLSILVNEELLLQDCVAPPASVRVAGGLSILVNEELLLQAASSSWRCNWNCGSFNPREWGTAFAREHAVADSAWKRFALSILVNEELLLQVVGKFHPLLKSHVAFNPREWGTAFARVWFFWLFLFFLAYKCFFSGCLLEHGRNCGSFINVFE